MKEKEDLSPAVKLKFISVCVLFVIAFALSTAFYVNYQRAAAEQSKALLQAQDTAVKARMTVFPDVRQSKIFKEKVSMSIVKINQDDLPATITAGLDETVTPNPGCSSVDVGEPGSWRIIKNGSTEVANDGVKNGWDVSAGGNVSIPATAEYGKYTTTWIVNDGCDIPNSLPFTVYAYVFKITPPCPTGVTLTHAGS